jgi:hypothetical protein
MLYIYRPLIIRKLNTLESVGLGKNDFGRMKSREHDPSQQSIKNHLDQENDLEDGNISDTELAHALDF